MVFINNYSFSQAELEQKIKFRKRREMREMVSISAGVRCGEEGVGEWRPVEMSPAPC